MKRKMVLACFVFCLLFAGSALYGQNDQPPSKTPDVSGTWTGETYLPGSDTKDKVILVLKKAGDKYSGTVTMLGAKEVPVEGFNFEDEDTFNFKFTLTNGDNKNVVSVKLDVINDKLLGDSLMGAWTIDTGDYGRLELAPAKK